MNFLQTLQKGPSAGKSTQTQQSVLKGLKGFLNNNLIELFGTDVREEYEMILVQINQDLQQGVCAKQINWGDVCWRCMDCEKDPTCIICKECFEKGDHTGHRVQLKRNAGGCCDCGDPEAWDEDHFCADHKGQHDIDPKKILEKLPHAIKKSAFSIFEQIVQDLKQKCMNLQNYDEQFAKENMSTDMYKETMIKSISLIVEFLQARIDESPAFIHILELELSKIHIEPTKFVNNEAHTRCCIRSCIDADKAEHDEVLDRIQSHENKEKLCTCTTLDLCMQTNYMLDDDTRKQVYDLFYKMFQSYHFKQCLTLSYASNFEQIMERVEDSETNISSIGVQVLTSGDLTTLLFQKESLRNNVLRVLNLKMKEFKNDLENQQVYVCMWHILHDLKYMARPEILQYCVRETDWIERLIEVGELFYFIDAKAPRETMIDNMHDGQYCGPALELELFFAKILQLYLQEIDSANVEKNRSIMKTFLDAFIRINSNLISKAHAHQGFITTPVHRAFAFFFTRLLMNNRFDKDAKYTKNESDMKLSLQQVYRSIMKDNLPEYPEVAKDDDYSSLTEKLDDIEKVKENEKYHDIDDMLQTMLLAHVKQISFIHEIGSRKWVYYGYILEHYPNIYYKLCDKLSMQDLCLVQMLLACDNMEDKQSQLKEMPAGEQASNYLIDYVIDNFGLDGQLGKLFTGIKTKKLMEKDFSGYHNFDHKKLRVQLLFFLRFMIQVCVCEVSFLKQLYHSSNVKDEKPDNYKHIKIQNEEMKKEIWEKAIKKEAVHLLLLNKFNVGIEKLRESMLEIFKKDENFEKALFDISTQSRDIKNQVTFKLKDEYYAWLDPYQYIWPDQQSQIYQIYKQNQLESKFIKEGMNDIVGDYKQNYTFATDVNQQLIDNLARSQMPKLICTLLSIWLKFRNQDVDPNAKKDEGDTKKDLQSKLAGLFTRLQVQSQANQPGTIMNQVYMLQRAMTKTGKLNLDGSWMTNAMDNSKDDQNKGFDEQFLYQIVDQNAGICCLKLLTMILEAHSKALKPNTPSKLTANDRNSLTSELKEDPELIVNILGFREENKENKKMHDILTHIIEQIYKLDNSQFQLIGIALGHIQDLDALEQSQTNVDSLKESQSQVKQKSNKPEMTKEEKKDKLNKKKNKLLQKMKSRGAKTLENKTDSKKIKTEEDQEQQEEELNCAFCMEELKKSNFISNPYGNFAFIQKSNLLYHTIEQTIQSQRKAFNNADLQNQILQNPGVQDEESKGQGSSLIEEEKTQQNYKSTNDVSKIKEDDFNDLLNQIMGNESEQSNDYKLEHIENIFESKNPQQKLKSLNLVKLICQKSRMMNKYTASGGVFTNCKHYAHLECLQKYHQQQETVAQNFQQKQINGLTDGEFACPICKSINNSLMPIYSLRDITKDIEGLSIKEKKIGQNTRYHITDQAKSILDFYADFNSQIIVVQEGFINKDKISKDDEKIYAQKSILLRDFKKDPIRVINQTCSFFNHMIHLTDLKGLNGLMKHNIVDKMASIHSSFCELLHLTNKGEHFVLDATGVNHDVDRMIFDTIENNCDQMMNSDATKDEKRDPVFKKNISITCIETLILASLHYLNADGFDQELYHEAIEYILKQFYNLLRIQFMLATIFRQNNGKLKGRIHDVMKDLSCHHLVQLEDQIFGESSSLDDASAYLLDIYVDIELPVMRKLFTVVYMLRQSALSQSDQEGRKINQDKLSEICSQTSNLQELKIIKQYLNLDCGKQEDDMQVGVSFKDLLIENLQQDLQIPNESLLELNSVLERFDSQKLLSEMLLNFAISMTEYDARDDNQDKQIQVDLPTNLLLMTPYYIFNFVDIPSKFMTLQTEYYKRKCTYCDQEKLETITCLLCDKTMCMFNVKYKTQQIDQCRVGTSMQQDMNEGLMCWHTKIHEGGLGIFLKTSSGKIMLVQDGNIGVFDAPYRNKYGEMVHENNKEYDKFNIDEQGGGLESLKQLKQRYIDHQIANLILQQRTNPDSKYKVYMRNIM